MCVLNVLCVLWTHSHYITDDSEEKTQRLEYNYVSPCKCTGLDCIHAIKPFIKPVIDVLKMNTNGQACVPH